MDTLAPGAAVGSRRPRVQRSPRHISPPLRSQQQQQRDATRTRAELFGMLEPLLFRYVDLFEEIDADGDGTVTADELLAAFDRKRVAAPAEKVRQLFDLMDEDGNGEVSVSEFLDEMRKIKLAKRSLLTGAERARRLRRASTQRERRRRQLNAQASAGAKERRTHGTHREPSRQRPDEGDANGKMRRKQAAAWRAFEQERAAQLRWRRSAQSTSNRERGRFVDVDPNLRGVPTPATWSSDLLSFSEQHREVPTSPQQQVVSLLAREHPASQAAEIWEQSMYLGTQQAEHGWETAPSESDLSLLQAGLNLEPEPEPEPEPQAGSTTVRVSRERPGSAPAQATAAVESADDDHSNLHHDHTDRLLKHGNWDLDSEKSPPGVQLDTGGRTVWIGQVPKSCTEEPHLLQDALEKDFGAIDSISIRTKAGFHRSCVGPFRPAPGMPLAKHAPKSD